MYSYLNFLQFHFQKKYPPQSNTGHLRPTVEYLSPINPMMVEIIKPKENELKNLKKWSNPQTLNKFYFNSYHNFLYYADTRPSVKREIICGSNVPKYKIIDGVHRIAFAQYNNIPTVLAIVEDVYLCSETWIKQLLAKK